MIINRSSDEKLAEHYDEVADRALANPALRPGLADQIARVSRTTAATLRKPRADKGVTRGPYKPERPAISVRLDTDVAAALDSYQTDVPDYSRNSTINEALRWYLALQEVEETEGEEIRKLLSPHLPRRD